MNYTLALWCWYFFIKTIIAITFIHPQTFIFNTTDALEFFTTFTFEATFMACFIKMHDYSKFALTKRIYSIIIVEIWTWTLIIRSYYSQLKWFASLINNFVLASFAGVATNFILFKTFLTLTVLILIFKIAWKTGTNIWNHKKTFLSILIARSTILSVSFTFFAISLAP